MGDTRLSNLLSHLMFVCVIIPHYIPHVMCQGSAKSASAKEGIVVVGPFCDKQTSVYGHKGEITQANNFLFFDMSVQRGK